MTTGIALILIVSIWSMPMRDAANWVEIHNQDRDLFQASLRLDYTIKPDAPIDYGEGDALTGD